MNLKKIKSYAGELLYLLSSIVLPGIGFITSILVAKFVDPKDNGLIESYFLILPYLGFLQLGVFNGLNRNIAFYKAKNELSKVNLQVNTSLYVSRAVAIISIIFVLIFVIINNNSYKLLDYFAITGVLIISVLSPIALHIDTTFRSGQDFKKLGALKLYEAGLQLLLTPLLVFFKGYGKVLMNTGKVIINAILRLKNSPYKLEAKFDFKSYKELLSVGFPLLFGGYLFILFTIADQSIIGLNLGSEQLGYYFLSKLVLTIMLLIPSSLTSILYPKASALFGTYGKPSSLRKFFWNSLLINFIVLSFIGLIIYFSIDFIVFNYIPKYLPGVEAAKINVITGFSFLSIGPGVIMGVIRKNRFYIFLVGLSLLAMWGVSFFTKITSIEQVAYYRCIISLILSIGTIFYSYYLTFSKHE
ncbi:hypothetical protein FDT66_12250 [Polaribacter aestuariivivens]|uniref:Polysaccharide biosynthesis protein n=1 Tax=Polaribacter aestuariivivens TaxID=2304626 RepID=A0A5S3N2T5_9FLAO|nr:oligosaccharide flippase family protein [Polaribacter aestuariivivens]TMM29152.1 hypothetical protein FDT66_12250 [Polaribacter aestuariivivens]